ncbi:MAG: abortive infection family protein [Candidatus Hydrogenedentales bacterium]|jgi:hypothetical protein
MSENFDSLDLPDTAIEQAKMLQNMLHAVARGGVMDDKIYADLRMRFMAVETRQLLPEFVRTCRDRDQLWGYFKQVASNTGAYEARRKHIFEGFQPLLDYLEGVSASPADPGISEVLASFDADGVHRSWERALSKREDDPEGAITAARTLLETVCKHILDAAAESYNSDDDLPKLYGRVSRILNLAPSQHTEEIFRAILGGCHTVVQNLGTIRNRISDAHGQGRNPVRPAPRHATLAVNLAGAMATFLVETWQSRENGG